MMDEKGTLTSGRRLARNVLWNLLGIGVPLLAAVVAIPILIKGLGTDRFGVLTLAWMLVGYFSLFDLGLSRALTKLVAENLSKRHEQRIPSLIWTSLSLMAVLGIIGAAVVAFLADWLVRDVLKIPVSLRPETLTSFYILAASIPVVIGATGLRGILEAHQRFGLVNAVRIPLGLFTFVGPLLVLPFSRSLSAVVTALVFARLLSWCTYAALCIRVEPALLGSVSVRRSLVPELISFGGWMTITNIVSPLMVYMDRFLIGAVVSMAAVAYYTTPYEIVTKLWIIPTALMGVVFPAFAAFLVDNPVRAARLFGRAVSYIFMVLFPVVLIIVTFAREGLTAWLGSGFAENSTLVLQFLAIGIFINGHAHVPFGLLQSAGRPDLVAKLHLCELPVYLVVLWWLMTDHGIVGAAVAWLARVVVDAVIIFAMARRILPNVSSATSWLVVLVSIALIFLASGAMIPNVEAKIFFLLIVMPLFIMFSWFVILDAEEKNFIRNFLKVLPTGG